MTGSKRMQAIAGVLGVLVCLALTAYFGLAAPGHPHLKHMILFIGLAGVSALVVWFSMPPRMNRAR